MQHKCLCPYLLILLCLLVVISLTSVEAQTSRTNKLNRRIIKTKRIPALVVEISSQQALLNSSKVSESQTANERVIRSREIDLNLNILPIQPRSIRQGSLLSTNLRSQPSFTLKLFDDVDYIGIVERTEVPSPNSIAWSGRIENNNGTFTFIRSGNGFRGNVRSPNGYYEISYRGNKYVVEQIDTEKLKECSLKTEDVENSNNAIPAVPSVPLAVPSPTPTPEDGSVIDVLVLYTPAARDAMAADAGEQAGTDNAIRRLIDTLQTESNTIYANSRINTRLNIVHRAQIAYSADITGDAAMRSILGHLTYRRGDGSDPNGLLDDAHTLRNTHRADIVVLIVRDNNEGGRANAMDNDTFNKNHERMAFAVVAWDDASANFIFQHEIGHIQGLEHHRLDDGSTRGVYCDSYGYRFRMGSDWFRTIMSYRWNVDSELIPHFSNPNVNYERNGVRHTTGVAITDSDPNAACDEARTINNTRQLVANFRNRNAP